MKIVALKILMLFLKKIIGASLILLAFKFLAINQFESFAIFGITGGMLLFTN